MKKNCTTFFTAFFFFSVFVGVSLAEGIWDYYEINAQYRGGVKKGFEQLGCGIAYFNVLADGKKQVIFHACVKHPQKRNSYYSFRVNFVYSSTPTSGKIEKEIYCWFDGFEAEHITQVKDMILFLAMMKDGSLFSSTEKEVMVNSVPVKVVSKLIKGGKRHEVSANRAGQPPIEGKFFSNVDPTKKIVLDKFHLRRDKISVSFVVVPFSKIQEKFQAKAPFDKVVFAK